MTEDRVETTIRRAIGGDEAAIAAVLAVATDSDDPRIVALASVLASRRDWIARAQTLATSTRDRQVVAISASHLSGERDLVQVLARDHLSDHPDSLIVAWIASRAGEHGEHGEHG